MFNCRRRLQLPYPHDSNRLRRLGVFFAGLVLWLTSATVHAQFAGEVPEVAREFIERVRRLDGESLRMCVYDGGLTARLDRRIAETIGDVLLVNVDIVSIPSAISVPGIEFVPISEDELYIYLNNDCDGFLGFVLAADVYPDWLTFTRPYVSTTFSVLTTHEGYERLGAFEAGRLIGTTLLSEADLQLLGYNNALSADRRWRRIPYSFASLLLERLVDGSVDAALMWTPSWAWLQDVGETPTDAVRVISASPLTLPTRDLGIILRSNETFIRNALDQAIAAMISFDVLDELYEEVGFPGSVPAR
jgi:hypothetical protein